MRRVAAISAGPRSASPRGRRAFSLLVLLGLSAISVYIVDPIVVDPIVEFAGVVAAACASGKGSEHGTGRDSRHGAGPKRSRGFLAAVHVEPRLQGSTAPSRPRQGHALLHARRARSPRRHLGPL